MKMQDILHGWSMDGSVMEIMKLMQRRLNLRIYVEQVRPENAGIQEPEVGFGIFQKRSEK